MQYRDIIPGRQGGRFIGSHIRIPEGGPVPDYVHYHKVRFQMIYCHKGWVRLVYEDQGEPFVLHAGDCVLQPPEIRHRVLESGDGLRGDRARVPGRARDARRARRSPLPTGASLPERDFGGQRFVRHDGGHRRVAPVAVSTGFEYRDIGIGEATDGLAGVRVARPIAGGAADAPLVGARRRVRVPVRAARLGARSSCVDGDQGRYELVEGDTVVVPAGMAHRLSTWSSRPRAARRHAARRHPPADPRPA